MSRRPVALVIDASVAMGWLVSSQATPLTDAALPIIVRNPGLVPAHFGMEVAVSLRRLERRGLLTPSRIDSLLARLKQLHLRQDADGAIEPLQDVLSLARRYMLKLTDAAYLELAIRAGLPLATRDATLAAAARIAHVNVFGV